MLKNYELLENGLIKQIEFVEEIQKYDVKYMEVLLEDKIKKPRKSRKKMLENFKIISWTKILS